MNLVTHITPLVAGAYQSCRVQRVFGQSALQNGFTTSVFLKCPNGTVLYRSSHKSRSGLWTSQVICVLFGYSLLDLPVLLFIVLFCCSAFSNRGL